MHECIVRMEMPNECPCELWHNCNPYIKYSMTILDASMERFPRPKPLCKGCRIICQLPEGHGRLVDASVLKNKNMRKPRGVSSYDYGAMATVFMDTINDTPTIVPAEAKRKVDAHDAVAPTDTPTDTPTVAAERSET